ncbi:hypothetical protein RHMOL_Rhmol04G0280500 [Rhododendron molle]|uniref:Uncharacterized protein n=1 Tax=Rhododendron molle TaxID=49168 RepID=A0ACC0P504_RHOML|nr:hypothetical protein RHMOL_Rhmol04G0280500 [Rhododendron molle]
MWDIIQQNLRQTLDDLTRNGYSVCIVEEVQGPTQARSRKDRFISGHAHPGSPYVFGLVGADHDLDFPEPMPVVGMNKLHSSTSNAFSEFSDMVKELYGLNDEVTFRNITVTSENRPRPIHLGTATQIGAIPTEGIPSLLKVLLPPNCTGLPVLYIRDLLLNPPAYAIASTIQECGGTRGRLIQLVKLLELREANHIEFCKIKSVLDEILQMYKNPELLEILKLLMDPTWVATGLKIDFDKLVSECEWTSTRIGEIISLDVESDQQISSYPNIPSEFFEDMESSWKGRVKRIHLEEAFEEVEKAAVALSLAVSQDFLPIISRIKASTAPLGGPKGEILYAREHEAVWFKGKRFTPAVWAGTPGEVQIKQLKAAVDSKGRKVGEEWFTTVKVEDALTRYHEAGAEATARVLELLRTLSAELQSKINILVFASMLLVIAKALFAHVRWDSQMKFLFNYSLP